MVDYQNQQVVSKKIVIFRFEFTGDGSGNKNESIAERYY